MTQQTSTALLQGGQNLVTPAIAVPPGQLIGGVNYEPEVRGIRRVTGYERYDGQPRPSLGSYWVLEFDQGTAAISEGDQVTGATSGATGKALEDATVQSGSYGEGNADGFLVLTDVTGTFQDDENLQVSAATKCVMDGPAEELGAEDDTDHNTWLRGAIATRRALIAAVPGEGAVRGVHTLNGDLYAIRNNVGSTAGVLHKATSSGWSAQDLGSYVQFDAGTTAFVEGETVTAASGGTATVRRVVIESGAWDTTGTGFLVISGATGTFADNDALTGSVAGAATQNGTVTANALPPGGHYDFTVHNFYGAAYSEKMYGCQGEGYAFEWDGTYFAPIRTGLGASLDKPIRIAQYKNHLFLGYAAGTINTSEIGEPLQYRSTGGAMSFAFGSPITDFPEEESTVLLIFGRSQISYIVGNDASDFQLIPVSHDSGAIEWTVQTAGSPTYLDDAGVRNMVSTEAFGNWRLGTLTAQIEPLVRRKRNAGVTAVASIRVRSRDQYRVFFSDKTGLTVYVGREQAEVIPFKLEHQAFCSCVGYVNGEEQESLFVGCDDGYVMELERGTSFDGEKVFAWARLMFNHMGTPTQKKAFKKATLECEVSGPVQLNFIPEVEYANPNDPSGSEKALTVQGGGGVWDDTTWGSFVWSAQIVGQAHAYLSGIGTNLSIAIISEATHEEPHTLSSITYHFTYRGLKR